MVGVFGELDRLIRAVFSWYRRRSYWCVASNGKSVVVTSGVVEDAKIVEVQDNDSCDRALEKTISFEEVGHVGVKWRLRNLQENCRAKKSKVENTVAEVFDLVTEILGGVKTSASNATRATSNSRIEALGGQLVAVRGGTNEPKIEVKELIAHCDATNL